MSDNIDGFLLNSDISDKKIPKRILITGANSYIGDSFKKYIEEHNDSALYSIDILDTVNLEATPELFQGYDTVFNVAGIAHVRETAENKHLYDLVNRKLSIEIAKSAKEAGIKHLVLLSTMSVYGKVEGHILKDTVPNPVNAYGESKIQADLAITAMADSDFEISILRPPMVYGPGCKGNYQSLRKLALKVPLFPLYDNQRSMIFIGNLCEFVKKIIDNRMGGIFFPQNKEYVATSQMVEYIAKENNKKVYLVPFLSIFVLLFGGFNLVKKVFGNLTYEKVDTIDLFSFEESIRLTEQ